MDAVEIISQLDTAAEEYACPDLNNGYFYAVDARLHAYRDARRWALIVETVGYSPRARNLTDVLHIFGNCLADIAERVAAVRVRRPGRSV
jgi:hypothetical protein